MGEDSNLTQSLQETEREDQLEQDTERLQIEAKDAFKANMKRQLIKIAKGYKHHVWALNDELHTCSKSTEKIAEQLRYSRSKAASVHGLIDQEASVLNAITARYGG